MKLPDPHNTISSMIDKYHHSAGNNNPRPHMGCSLLGHHCDRWLWLNFRWAVREDFDGRILRVFRRGMMEEDVIVRDLRAIGIDIRFTGKRGQRTVNFGCHVSGSMDGIIESGVPEAPKKRHVAEFKTHSKKSFEDLLKNGVEKSKPMHFVQMQVYMHGVDIDRALYFAICKDDDRIYTERVRYDADVATKAIERGQRIAMSERMPEPVSGDPSWYQCKFCPAHSFCHKQQPTKYANCRTCAHATPMEYDEWHCARHDAVIPQSFQTLGCDDHVLHPDMVPWPMIASEDGLSAMWKIGDKVIENGNKPGAYKSREIITNTEAVGHPIVEEAKRIFPDAEIVG